MGGGIGNIIMMTPLVNAFSQLGKKITLYIIYDADIKENIFKNWKMVEKVFINKIIEKRFSKYIFFWGFKAMAKKLMSKNQWYLNKFLLKVHPSSAKFLIVKEDKNSHEAEWSFKFARIFNFKKKMPPYYIDYEIPDIQLPKKTVFFHAGSKNDYLLKRYPYFNDVVSLLKKRGWFTVTLGTKKDDNLITDMDLRSKLSIRQTAGLIKKYKYIICNDSGIMHIAFAMGGNGVALFGPTSSVKNGPMDKSKIIMMRSSKCFADGCYYHGEYRNSCPYHQICMKSISPHEVADSFINNLIK